MEFRYFGLEHATASLGPILSSDGIALNVPDDDPTFDPTAVEMTGASSLQSFEWNLRRNVSPRLTWLAGLRYICFRDAMGLRAGDPTLTNYGSVLFGARNNLFGLQIGADAIVWQNGCRFPGRKRAEGRRPMPTALRQVSKAAIPRTTNSALAWVGTEPRLSATWPLRASTRSTASGPSAPATSSSGYPASLSDPWQFHNFDAGLTPNTSGTVLFHGALIGLERSW